MSVLAALLAATPTPAPSGSPSITDWGNRIQQQVRDTAEVADTMHSACGSQPGMLCRITFDLTHDGTTARFVRDFLAAPLKVVGAILFVVVLAWIVRRLAHRVIDRMVLHAGETTVPERLRRRGRAGHEGTATLLNERRRQRAQTTGSVLRSIATVVIFGIATLMILQDLGMNLAPLLASAGVAGVAVGFGAQNLVRDYMSGIFMLLEDQYGVGDTIDVGEVRGIVEAVTLRTTRLRDDYGVTWYVRNGEITRVANETQGWAYAIADVAVAPDTDVDRLLHLLREMGAALRAEPEWAAAMMADPEVWGVQLISGNVVVIRIAAKTLPLKQYDVAPELRRRAHALLRTEGIEQSDVELTAADLK